MPLPRLHDFDIHVFLYIVYSIHAVFFRLTVVKGLTTEVLHVTPQLNKQLV